MTRTTAANLPPELLRPIAASLGPASSTASRVVVKKGLAACSLTCRDWAEVVRPFLFSDIELRSPEDIQDMIVMLR